MKKLPLKALKSIQARTLSPAARNLSGEHMKGAHADRWHGTCPLCIWCGFVDLQVRDKNLPERWRN